MPDRPFEVYILCLLLLILSAGALYGGGALILKPDGSLLQMQSWLTKIPFGSFLIPGLLLFTLNGLFPLVVVAGLLFRPACSFLQCLNIYHHKHWSWTFAIYSGIISITWIIIQQFISDFFLLQPIVAANGLLIIIFSLMPRVMQHYSVTFLH